MVMRRPAATMWVFLALCLCALAFAKPLWAQEPQHPVRVRLDRNFPPYEFVVDGQPTGFNVELFIAAARTAGLVAEFSPGPWKEVRADLELGKIDALTGMFYSADRDQLVDFSATHVVVSYTLFTRKDSGIRSVSDVRGKRLVVQQGDIGHDYAIRHQLSDRVTALPDQIDALRELAAGKHDAAILARMQGLYLAHKFQWTNLVDIEPPLETRSYCFAVREGDAALRSQLDEGLTILKTTGEYKRIYDKWFGPYEQTSAQTWKAVARIAVPLAILLALAGGWLWVLRKQVASRTAELSRELEERLRAEDGLRRFEQVVAVFGDHALFVDPELRCTAINDACLAAFGLSREQVVGRPVADLFGQETFDAAFRVGLEKCFAGERVEYDATIRFPTMGERIMSIRGIAHRNQENAIDGATLVARDITEQKLADEALRTERDFNSTLVQLSPSFFVALSPEGKVRMMNRSMLETLGYTPEEVEGKDYLTSFIPEEDREGVMGIVQRLLSTSSTTINENRVLAKNGQVRLVEWHGRAVYKGSSLQHIFGVGLDVTERLRARDEKENLEAQLRQAQKMEAVGQLAGGVAHDFNNILTAIFGNLEIATAALKGEVLERDMALLGLEEAERSAHRAAALTSQLLLFSRRDVARPKVVSTSSIVANMEGLLRRLVKENISLTFLLGKGIPPIEIDPGQLEQVVLNLVVNGCDAMPAGGDLRVETSLVDLDSSYVAAHADSKSGPHILLSVQDTGCGMSAEIRDRIFEPFFTTKPAGRGTGLGLSTVYGIVRRSGGHLAVESAPGQGSSFHVYLPASESAAPDESFEDASPDVVPRGTETVLVCEDNQSVRQLTVRILSDAGYIVHAEESGDRAIVWARSRSKAVDLLLTDVIMPGMNGRELATSLRATWPTLRTLYVSGYESNVIGGSATQSEREDFLHKPFSRAVLLRKVREVLDRRSPPGVNASTPR